MKEKIKKELKNELSKAMRQHSLTIKEILSVCSDAIEENVMSSGERESNLKNALHDTFNVEERIFNRYDVFTLAKSICAVFPVGVTNHSVFQKRNFERYKEAFHVLKESDKKFLLEENSQLKRALSFEIG